MKESSGKRREEEKKRKSHAHTYATKQIDADRAQAGGWARAYLTTPSQIQEVTVYRARITWTIKWTGEFPLTFRIIMVPPTETEVSLRLCF